MAARRLRNFFLIFAFLLAAYFLQYSCFSMISYIKGLPDLMLVVVFSFSYQRGKNTGLLAGFFGGLMIDVLYCQVIGFNALLFLVIGFVCGLLNKSFYTDHLLSQIAILLLCELSYCLIYFIFWDVLQSNFAFGYVLMSIIIPRMLLTLIAGLVLLKPMEFVVKKMYVFHEAEE